MDRWFLPSHLAASGCPETISFSEELCLLPLDALHWHPWEEPHPSYLISDGVEGLLELGSRQIRLERESILPVNTGMRWYVPNGLRHTVTLVIVRSEFDLSVRLTLGLCPGAAHPCAASPRPSLLPILLEDFRKEVVAPPAEALLLGRALARLILVELLKSCYSHDRPVTLAGDSPKLTDRPELKRAIEAMQANYTRHVSLDELARVATLSRSHFLKEFHEEVGLTPHTYLLRLRVLKARELLVSMPTADVSTIAGLAGFAGSSQLHRAFKSFTGLTPAQYRHSCEE